MKMNKKALSILLAASMVFSMNISSFAAETTATEVTTIETQSQYKSHSDNNYVSKFEKAYDAAISNNKTQSLNAQKSGVTFGSVKFWAEAPAAGKKMTAKKLKDEIGNITISVNGYQTIATDYKITSNSKTPGSTISFKVKSFGGYKYVTKLDADGTEIPLTSKQAKEGYKAIKAQKSTIKNTVFQVVLENKEFYGVVSNNFIKAIGKKAVSRNAVVNAKLDGSNVDIRDYVVVTKKNGKIKKVQYVTLEPVSESHTGYYYIGKGSDEDSESSEGSKGGNDDTLTLKRGFFKANNVKQAYNVKIKLKNLKKNKDYTIENNKVVLNGSRNYYDGVGSDQDFTANW